MHTTFSKPAPPSSLSLKGTDQMASELLNVQQPLASPDASLLHNMAHLHSDKFFNLCTKSSTSQHQVIYTQAVRRWHLIFGVMLVEPWLACFPAWPAGSLPPQLRYNDHLLRHIPMVLPLSWFSHFHTPKTSRFIPNTLSFFS